MTVRNGIVYLMALWLLVGCHNDDDAFTDEQPVAEIATLNIDVVLPATIQQQWHNATSWALENIAKAQQKQSRRVKLNLRYHDEDTADLDELAYSLTHPQKDEDSCHAIIGPYHSYNAQTFLSHAAQSRLPVVMPTCTSAELQRINAHNDYAWFLTESDITQCEIMVSTARALMDSDIALIFSPDTYGKSFADWFAYYAVEQGMHIAGGVTSYEKGDDLTAFLNAILYDAKGKRVRVLVALSDASDYKSVCDQIQIASEGQDIILRPLCADTSYDLQVLSTDGFDSFDIGVTPFASMHYGFTQSYYGHFLQSPINGEAQMYDALTIIALGAALRQASPDHCTLDDELITTPDLTDYMRAVVSSYQGVNTQWDAAGLGTAFNELQNGRPIDISGASGPLYFDVETYTKVLNTTYMIWKFVLENRLINSDPFSRVQPLLYLSTEGANGEASTTSIWMLEKLAQQAFDEFYGAHSLPPVTDHWAVLISPSTTWSNYRHQADVFAMYQLLRHYGYDDDHIVLIVEDNLAHSPANKDFPGQIFVERSSDPNLWDVLVNEDVRQGAVVDYHFSDLRPEDVGDILMGRQSSRLPHVIHPDSTSNVFLFWSGHGNMKEGPLWGNEDAKEGFGNERIKEIVSQMNDANMYRRMMLAVETCYSGQWGEVLDGQPDVLVLTSANAIESSKADVFDQQLGVYLSNAFTRTFRSKLSWSGITLYNLYRELYKTTTGSHVTIYNHQQYGSVYTETMNDYFPFLMIEDE
ncbi:MAG: ABC transporter substrate-binding protein [Bacteroidaceae bacterium]|nr:ABC transporter substrate-binding protein [Bacteroidaceae bacterium]